MPKPNRDASNARAKKMLAPAGFAFLLTTSAMAADPPGTLPNGLTRVPDAKVELAYARPGIDLTKYKTIELAPLSVPQKVRNAAPNGVIPEGFESYVLRDDDVTDLQAAYAQVMRDTLGKAGFTFVTAPQADTLIVAVQVTNITLNAPIEDTRRSYSGPGLVMTQGAGSMAITAVLADGPTGTVIAEAGDRQYPTNIWRVNTRVSNTEDAKKAFRFWAQALSNRLTGAAK